MTTTTTISRHWCYIVLHIFSGKDMNVIREMTKGVIPQARVAEAEEMAKVIAFMVSEENTYMQGNEIFLDGGLMLTNSMNLPVMKQYLEATGKQ